MRTGAEKTVTESWLSFLYLRFKSLRARYPYERSAGHPGSASSPRLFGSDFYGTGELRDFQVYADGAYFSVDVGGELFHGDAWALASFLSTADPGIARQEVLYVGKAFGEDGSQNAWKRTQKHEKLQRIYEDHVNDAYEVFIAPLSLEQGLMSSTAASTRLTSGRRL